MAAHFAISTFVHHSKYPPDIPRDSRSVDLIKMISPSLGPGFPDGNQPTSLIFLSLIGSPRRRCRDVRMRDGEKGWLCWAAQTPGLRSAHASLRPGANDPGEHGAFCGPPCRQTILRLIFQSSAGVDLECSTAVKTLQAAGQIRGASFSDAPRHVNWRPRRQQTRPSSIVQSANGWAPEGFASHYTNSSRPSTDGRKS